MASCEKCWRDSGGSSEEYERLLAARKDDPCSPQEQAGQWWDDLNQCDIRVARLQEPK